KRWADRYRVGVPLLHRSTVGRVLARYGMPKLVNIDRATGLPARKPNPVRYEVDRPGQLVHVDIKKQGHIPDGGGWRVHGKGSVQDRAASSARGKATRAGAAGSRGYRYLHHAVDDHSRVAHSEVLAAERKASAAAFWSRPPPSRAALGIAAAVVRTAPGSCSRSPGFTAALGVAINHKRTRPHRPQTNG